MSTQPIHDADGELAIGQPAPAFDLPGVDGKNHSLEDYRGSVKALAVIFSCNHCPYVIKTEDRMIELANAYKARGVEFVIISANNVVTHPADSFDNMKRRSQEKGYPFPYLYNEDQSVAHAYGAKVTPHVFLFDGNFVLRYRGAIDDNIDDPGNVRVKFLQNAIETILSGEGSIANEKTHARGCSVKWK